MAVVADMAVVSDPAMRISTASLAMSPAGRSASLSNRTGWEHWALSEFFQYCTESLANYVILM